MAPDLTIETWAQIRYDYEHTDRPVADICAEHGFSSGTLRDRVRRWNWTPRREPIPREGPPAVARIEQPPQTVANIETVTPTPDPSPQEPAPGRAQARPGWGGAPAEFAAPIVPDHAANAEADAAGIVPRLQSAVARVLPAIEATLQRLAAGPMRPREMEQTARALGALMRTLRELNALLAQQTLRAVHDDPVPEDVDEFRFELARRIHAFIEAREAQKVEAEADAEAEAEAPTLSARPRESGDPETDDSEQAAAGFPLARE